MPLTSSTPPPEPSGPEVPADSTPRRGRRWPQLRRLALVVAAGVAVLLLWAALAPMRGSVEPTRALGGRYGAGAGSYTLLGERLQVQGDTVYAWARTGNGRYVLLGAACGLGQLAFSDDAMPRDFMPPIPGTIGPQMLDALCQAAPITAGARLRFRSQRLWAGLPGTQEPCSTPECALARLREIRAERAERLAAAAAKLEAAAPARMDSTMARDTLPR